MWVTAVAADATASPATAGRGTVDSGVATFAVGLELFVCVAELVTPVPPLRDETAPSDADAERPERLRAEG